MSRRDSVRKLFQINPFKNVLNPPCKSKLIVNFRYLNHLQQFIQKYMVDIKLEGKVL